MNATWAAIAARAAQPLAQAVAPPLNIPLETKVTLLQNLYQEMNKRHTFKPGQLIKWKVGMQVRPYPLINDPAIIVDVLNEPIFDGTMDASFASFREPLDLVVGCLGSQAQFVIFHFSSFRFEPY
jgi:hypothetical protein